MGRLIVKLSVRDIQGAMTVAEVKNTEDIVNEVIGKDQPVYAKEAPLADAKAIQGLRAVFDEVFTLSNLFLNTWRSVKNYL